MLYVSFISVSDKVNIEAFSSSSLFLVIIIVLLVKFIKVFCRNF